MKRDRKKCKNRLFVCFLERCKRGSSATRTNKRNRRRWKMVVEEKKTTTTKVIPFQIPFPPWLFNRTAAFGSGRGMPTDNATRKRGRRRTCFVSRRQHNSNDRNLKKKTEQNTLIDVSSKINWKLNRKINKKRRARSERAIGSSWF